jgi:hypothetical protein
MERVIFYKALAISWVGIAILVVIFSSGCEEDRNRFPEHNIYYAKDIRTNLCFAILSGSFGGSVVNIPCSSEVENNLLK